MMRSHGKGRVGWREPVAGLLALTMATACADEPTVTTTSPATIQMHSITPATVRTLVVEVSGPGISPAQLFNLPVNALGVASGTIETSAGSRRRIVVTAVDTAGAATHRGDTTVTLVPGPNPPLALVLRPLGASLGITVTFGALRVMPPRDEEIDQ